MMPQSLRGRLLAIAAAATLVALVVAGFGIAHVLERYVTSTIDERLDDRLAAFAAAVTPAGGIDRPLADRVAAQVARGAAWRIETPRGTVGTARLGPIVPLTAPRPHDRPPPDAHRPEAPRPQAPPPPAPGTEAAPFDTRLADGSRVHGRWLRIPTIAGEARVAVAVPRRMIERPVRTALAPLLIMLALLGALLAAATLVQLRVGLRPLDRLREMLAEVRAGRRRHIDLTLPTELQPIVTELNTLIDSNHAALERARGHVANLAHGLKTPLAALRLDLPGPAFAPQLDRIEAQIRHHLGRARAASLGDMATPAIALAPVVADLSDALARIHADRAVTFAADVTAALAVRCDRQDLEELLGNLLDNAWRHAAGRVTLTATADRREAVVTIADDGPGIPPALLAEATRPGRRLDERGDGHGFGIPIARELIELHGGSLTMASDGGLRVTIRLPAG
ncbi:HAMP domain-containing sensor histidine kinase [Sphingomonas sp. KR1UV-12]|uniref:histidine kinase n=1 Tax=Sphingomonas aurea TaxID=3063994 RepID=A0ABT9EL91_9SPHN|nr:HAMP domain-containing sensor histidine kinase [Sphingomonas sp. KR1UV-12]MDP1027719.1 HAMP domain-containing sensor histidine kinase [Sphingomonas sp. KR1UV-12]